MGLADNPDFQRWLERYAARHELVHGHGPASPAGVCDGCADPLPDPPSSAPFCMVCLAEHYGRDRARSAGRIANALRAAIAEDPVTPLSEIREAIEEVLAEVER